MIRNQILRKFHHSQETNYVCFIIHYDLNSWTAGLGALMADHRSDEDEFGLVFTLTLKDFPSLSLPVGITPSH